MVNCKQIGLDVLSYGVNARLFGGPTLTQSKVKPEKVVVKLQFLLGVFNLSMNKPKMHCTHKCFRGNE